MLKTCRTCLLEIRDTTYIMLNKTDMKGKTVRTKLLACVPELQLDLVKDPVICRNCVNVLHLAHSFKTRCLYSEKRIRSCIKNAILNGKPVTLTKLFTFSRESKREKNCSSINSSVVKDPDVNSNPSAGECFPSRPGRPSVKVEVDNDEHKRTSDYIISTANEDSNVVTSSEVGLVDGEYESDLQNTITNNGTTMGSTLQPLEFRDKILGWSSAATCTDIKGAMSQDLVNTMDDAFVKEEHESLPFKTETDEALSFKEESSNNEEESSNDCKIETWDDVKEETRSITDDVDGNNLIDNEEYEFPAATSDGENFEGSNSTNLDNQIKQSYVSVRRLSTNSNCPSKLYSDSTASSHANITEPIVKKRRVNYKEETTNNYSTSSLIQNSQEVSDTDGDSITKKEHELEIFKPKEPLNEITSAKLLQKLSKKPESSKHNRKSNFSEQQQAHSKKFCCNICDFSTSHQKNLNRHLRVHTSEKPFQCNVCEYSANRKYNLILHMRTHTGEKPFKCKVCDYRAVQKYDLIKHMRTHTEEKPFQCSVCEYSANRKQYLIVHMRSHTGEKPFQCDFCDFSTSYKTGLTKHLQIHTGEKPFQCNFCDFSTSYKTSLTKHLLIHTGEKPFKCNVCDYRAIQKYDVIKHMFTHTGEKPFQCNVCGYSANRKQYLIVHMRSHTGEKLFQCDFCDFSTSYKTALMKHLPIHSDEKPFKCNVCDYRAVQKYDLIKHMSTHTDEKPFRCNVCQYSATRKGILDCHMHIHTDEKPFLCNVCGYRKNQKQNLMSHMCTHTDE